jgi:hypothetical protein
MFFHQSAYHDGPDCGYDRLCGQFVRKNHGQVSGTPNGLVARRFI